MSFKESLLNPIFNKSRMDWRKFDVHIQTLLKSNPDIRDERTLREAINAQEGKHTLKEMAQATYDVHQKYSGGVVVPLEVWEDYIDDVYVSRSLKGRGKEDELLVYLKKYKPSILWDETDDELDRKYNVDIVGTHVDGEKVYIQVKPLSYQYTDAQVQTINAHKEANLGQRVHYAYYDGDNWVWEKSR